MLLIWNIGMVGYWNLKPVKNSLSLHPLLLSGETFYISPGPTFHLPIIILLKREEANFCPETLKRNHCAGQEKFHEY